MLARLRGIAVLACGLAAAAPAIPRATEGGDTSTISGPVVYQRERRVAPLAYAKVPWWQPDGSFAPGFWYSDAQIVKTAKRIDYLETKAARECVDQQIAAARKSWTGATWWKVAGGIVTGAAIGFCAGTAGHCGIGK